MFLEKFKSSHQFEFREHEKISRKILLFRDSFLLSDNLIVRSICQDI